MLSSSMLEISVFPNSHVVGLARYEAECIGSVAGSTRLVQCLTVVIVRRFSSGVNSNSDNMLKKCSLCSRYSFDVSLNSSSPEICSLNEVKKILIWNKENLVWWILCSWLEESSKCVCVLWFGKRNMKMIRKTRDLKRTSSTDLIKNLAKFNLKNVSRQSCS